MWNINAPQGRILCAIFTKFAEFVSRLTMCMPAVKFRWTCLRGYGVMGVLGVGFLPSLQHPVAAKLCVRPPKVLEVQEHARGPLSPCQVCIGLGFHPPPGWPKTLSFLSVVCLFVRHAFERQRLCARFRYEGVGVQKYFNAVE